MTGDEAFDGLVAWADEWRRDRDVHGMAIAVLRGQGEPQVAGLGVRERGTCDPVTGRTLFRTYYPSQRAAALTALVLAEHGDLDLDAPLSSLAPELAFGGPYGSDPTRPVLVRHALTESVGSWPGFIVPNDLGPVCEQGGALAAYLTTRPDEVLRFRPGDSISDSHLDHLLLGLAIQRAAGTATFVEAVREQLLDPLGLEDVAFDAEDVSAQEHVVVIDPPEQCDAAAPVGGLHIGTADLARLYRALTSYQVVSEPTLQDAYEGARSLAPSGPQGWPVQGVTLSDGERLLIDVSLWNLNGLPEIAEGDVPQSCILVAPDRQLVVAVQMLLSRKHFYLAPCAEALRRFEGVEIAAFDYRARDLAIYAGSYTNQLDGHSFVISAPGGPRLALHDAEGPLGTLAPSMSPSFYSDTEIPASIERDIFCGSALGCPVRFERDDAGAILGVNTSQGMAYRNE